MRALLCSVVVLASAMAAYAATPECIEARHAFVSSITRPFEKKSGFADIRAYGRLLSEESVVDGRFPGTRIFFFEGIAVRGFLDQSNNFWISKVEVTSPAFRFSDGLRIGQSLSQYTKVLGEPNELSPTIAVYEAEADSFVLHLKDHVVVRVLVNVYTG